MIQDKNSWTHMVVNRDGARESTSSVQSDGEYSVALPPPEIYRSTLAYFSRIPGARVSKQEEPNEIVVHIGSLTATELGNERGLIRVQIKEEGGKSQVSVRFSFVMPYLVSTAYWCSVWLILIFAVSLVFP